MSRQARLNELGVRWRSGPSEASSSSSGISSEPSCTSRSSSIGAFCSVRSSRSFLRADPGDRPLSASDEGRGFRGTDASGSGDTASTAEGGGGGSFDAFGSGGFSLSCAAATQLLVSFCVCSRNASRSFTVLSSASSSWSARSRWGVDRRGGMPRLTTTTRGRSVCVRSMSWAMVMRLGCLFWALPVCCPSFVQRARGGPRTFTERSLQGLWRALLALAGSRGNEKFQNPTPWPRKIGRCGPVFSPLLHPLARHLSSCNRSITAPTPSSWTYASCRRRKARITRDPQSLSNKQRPVCGSY